MCKDLDFIRATQRRRDLDVPKVAELRGLHFLSEKTACLFDDFETLDVISREHF